VQRLLGGRPFRLRRKGDDAGEAHAVIGHYDEAVR